MHMVYCRRRLSDCTRTDYWIATFSWLHVHVRHVSVYALIRRPFCFPAPNLHWFDFPTLLRGAIRSGRASECSAGNCCSQFVWSLAAVCIVVQASAASRLPQISEPVVSVCMFNRHASHHAWMLRASCIHVSRYVGARANTRIRICVFNNVCLSRYWYYSIQSVCEPYIYIYIYCHIRVHICLRSAL